MQRVGILVLLTSWNGLARFPALMMIYVLHSARVMHSLPYREAITEDVYGKLFKDVGCNEEGVQCYFSDRAARLGESPLLAFDSTTISTYSENQSEARQGYNKDGDGLNIIKLLTLYSVKAREPIAFAKQPGNIPDYVSVHATVRSPVKKILSPSVSHVDYSPDNEAKKELAFRKDLLKLKAQIEEGKTEFTKSAQKKLDKYLTCSRKGRGGQLKVRFNDKSIIKAKKYFGYFTLVSVCP